MDPPFEVKANVDASSARAEQADEARLDELQQRATPGVGRAHSVFLRKQCSCSSSYHISQPRGCGWANLWHNQTMEHGKPWPPPDDLGVYRPGDAGGLESEWASTSRFLGVAYKAV